MSSFLLQCKSLRTPVRSLLYIYWISALTNGLASIFVTISVFQKFSSVSINIVGAMLSMTGVMIGFCFFGYIISYFQLEARQGFYYSFISSIIGFITLSQAASLSATFLALFILGLGVGLFYLTVHTYELSETKDSERDLYSSLLEGGRMAISILAPLIATGIIYVSLYVFHTSSLVALFIMTPLFYGLGLFCFQGIESYKPSRIEKEDFVHFFSDKKNRLAQLYLGSMGITHILGSILLPVCIFYILGSTLKVGAYSTVVSLFAVMLIIVLGKFRHKGNRMALFGVSAIGVGVLLTFLGYNMTFISLVIFTIGNTILAPIMQVSDHLVSLSTMESIGRSGKDFYATMLLRDFSLWFWRMLGGGLFLLVSLIVVEQRTILSFGLYMLASMTILSFIGASLLVKRMRVVV